MSPTRLLLLPPLADSPALCLALDAGGGIVSRQVIAAGDLASGPRQDCVLAVPAQQISLHRLRLRANSSAQASAAAARLVEDRLAVPATSLHVAVSGDHQDDERWVAAVAPAHVAAWLERASRHGFQATAMVPDCLLLAAPEPGGWRVLQTDAGWRVRGESLAFSAEPDLARTLLDGHAATAASLHLATEADLGRGAVCAPLAIDLLQQRFSRHPSAPTGWAAWRSAALLAALALALPPLGFAAQALRHELALRSVDAQASSQLRAAASLPDAPGAPFPRANAALAAARAGDAFAITTGALFESLVQVPGAGVSGLEFGEDSLLAVTLDHDQPDDLPKLTAALAERGVSASLDATQPAQGRLRSTLLLGVAP